MDSSPLGLGKIVHESEIMKLNAGDILGPGGRIAVRLPAYEFRKQQVTMADAVAEALDKKSALIVEAGTGVGKSFGYLVPAILAVTENPNVRRVIVSTHTISLQEQLLSKDIPFLNSVIPREFTALLAKGRGNYVSLRRLGQAVERQASLFERDEETHQLENLRKWALDTSDGSLSSIDFRPWGTVWDEVRSDSSNCMGHSCPHRKKCFYFDSRQRVNRAQIIVVNHALFFSDLALREAGAAILPDYDAVVFDEAHTVESVAASHMGMSISSGQIDYTLRRLYNDQTHKGLFVHHDFSEGQEATQFCRLAADDLLADLHDVKSTLPDNGRVAISQSFENYLSPALRKLSGLTRKFSESMEPEVKHDFQSAAERLTGLANELEAWREQAVSDSVYWMESIDSRRNPRLKLVSAPIDVGETLRKRLFTGEKAVIMTSATLSTSATRSESEGGSFQFFQSRIGLTQADSLQLGSPFNFREQVKLMLPSKMPDPNTQKSEFETACVEQIKKYVAMTDGNAFVLFTSFEMLRNIERRLIPWLTEQNMAVYSQAAGMPRTTMIEQFKKNPRSVLLGVDSFWQGVDVPGDALQNVIIVKLPFSVPDQPLIEARLETIRKTGGDPFGEYQLPEAIIKLKQGFGRLIRTAHDKGIVVILDPRVRTKYYGRKFLEALPDCEIITADD